MKKIFVNQVGFLPKAEKKAVLNFNADEFTVKDSDGKEVLKGQTSHFGTDEISGEDTFVADFSQLSQSGKYKVVANDATSTSFEISENVYDKLMHDICKCFYYLRCGDALDKKYAGDYYHEPCHMTKATVYGEDVEPVDVCGGWHDAGDYGRYSTAGAVAVAHLLYGTRLFRNLLDVDFEIPEEKCDKGVLPNILAEVKVELDFLMKMQREDGSVWHKVTTFSHAPFIMPEDDKEELFLFPTSSLATADIAATFALAYTIYKDYDTAYANLLLERANKAYEWLDLNPEAKLFKNAEGSNTGEYPEPEDFSNRFWAACSMYEVTGDKKYYEDACALIPAIKAHDKSDTPKEYHGNIFTCFGWGDVAGFGSLSLILKGEKNELTELARASFLDEANRLCKHAMTNGFGLCMLKEDFIWGSNMELLKYMMVLTVANKLEPKAEFVNTITAGLDYLLGCNSMDTSYVTGSGEKAFKNPHLRPTAVDNIEQPWPGLVSGGPNIGLQDEKAQTLPKDSAPMKCYIDHVDCYSLNEITIYWNSPLVFVMAGLL
ncbi:glycoside hydrolase family 9 protein [Pseudobutyrivibrio xylanivorans]|uniref:Endoglucanase n=1 Tax=Pseudobutyrivibrio xylanivorans TaxID=185007 RepID=A0A5P6VQ70_PSEXY|nr:glycoside hydrolase family 9 protein [Pseudobutyrivibrio xylanivorans]QFJ54468.1 cellodextrinase [Pseudobutyrivibrio xylanivorans]